MPTDPPRPRLVPTRRLRLLALVSALVVAVVLVAAVVHLIGGGSSSASATTPVSSSSPTASSTAPSTASSTVTTTTTTATSASLSSTASPSTSASPAPVVTADAAADALRRAVIARNRHVAGRLSVAVTDLGTNVTAAYGAPGHGFATASIVKADILSTLLLQRHGKLTRGQRALATRMIEHSDNNAASALWRQIGGDDGLDEANERFGLTSTEGGDGSEWGTTTTTASDQLRLLRNIFTTDSELSASSRAYITSLMGDVEPDQDWGVSAADTRKGEHYYVKNGWLPRTATGLWVVNSIGSVQYHGHNLLIAVVSDGRHTMGSGVRVIESVAKDAAKAVTGL